MTNSNSFSFHSSSGHLRAVLSCDPVTTCLPSGVKHTDLTPPPCPLNSLTISPSSIDHRRAVQSDDPVTTCLPSGVKHTDHT